MEEIDLLTSLERISSKIPNRILKIEGYTFKKNHKEKLEIIIFKGFTSSTTHPIEIDLEKKVLRFDCKFTNFRLYASPLTESEDNFIRENHNLLFFLNQKNWI
tara:strand:- start:502 stop:810 length:309 start_codon:yes stop_codon:yes gene_type:complete